MVSFLYEINFHTKFHQNPTWWVSDMFRLTWNLPLESFHILCSVWSNNWQQGHTLWLMKILDPLARSASAIVSFLRFFLTLKTSLEYFKLITLSLSPVTHVYGDFTNVEVQFLTWQTFLNSLCQGFIFWLKIQSYSHEVVLMEFL